MSFEAPPIPNETVPTLSDEEKETERVRENFEDATRKRAEELGISSEEYLRTYAKSEDAARDYRKRQGKTSPEDPFELSHPSGEALDDTLHLNAEQRIRIEELQLDSLTGLHTLQAYRDELQKRASSVEKRRKLVGNQESQEKEPPQYSILYLDIDHFKKVNDTYGHPQGDKVIQAVAQIIKNSIRIEDFAVRIGGEELSVIVPGDVNAAVKVAERIRKSVENHPFDSNGKQFRVTVSLGVSSYIPDPDQHRMVADAALQMAKGNIQAFSETIEKSGIPTRLTEGQEMPGESTSRNQTWVFEKGTISKVPTSKE